LWLWFWLKEDRRRPEPRRLLILSFFGGALAVILVLPFQALAHKFIAPGVLLLFIWAGLEELIKLLVAFLIDFRKRSYDEPVDAMVYLLTVALGFSAFENILFLLKSYGEGGLEAGLTTASMRFLGATLLHVFSSSVLGGLLAMSFCKSRRQKWAYTLLGLISATVLHTMFNFFIINQGISSDNGNVLGVFLALWVGVLGLLLFFEKVKSITCQIKLVDKTT
jgi:protease PrsW